MKIVDHYFINNQWGNIHNTFSEMIKEFREEFDGEDETNCLHWNEYYDEIFELEDGTVERLYTE